MKWMRNGWLGSVFAIALAACGSSGAGDGGFTPTLEGDVCAGTAGQQANCPSGMICSPYQAGATSPDVCRKTCAQDADCTGGETCTGPAGTTCACDPADDRCTTTNSNTQCHPDYKVCVTRGTPNCDLTTECVNSALGICEPLGSAGCAGGAPDGGDAGANGCGTADTQGTCAWPEFCGAGGTCDPAQNLSSNGADSASQACATSSSTTSGNLDTDRMTGAKETSSLQPAANGAIITDLTQVLVGGQDSKCADLGTGSITNATAYTGGNVCNGGASDGAGRTICDPTEVAVLFNGHAYDSEGKFSTTEGTALDGQFYRLSANGSGSEFQLSSSGSTVGATTTGFIIPGSGWSAAGGAFTLVRCLGVSTGNYPDIMSSNPVTLHFADTGIPGNSFCAQWQP